MLQFTACMVFEITNHGFPEASTSEELWVMLNAIDKNTAVDLLMQNGAARNETFLNSANDEVEWLFKGLKNIQQVQSETAITELISVTNPTLSYVEFQSQILLNSINAN